MSKTKATKKTKATETKDTVLPRILEALSNSVKRLPTFEAYQEAMKAAYGHAYSADYHHNNIVKGAPAIPHLFAARPALDILDAFSFIPDGVFQSPRLTFRPARDEENKAVKEKYAVPAGYTFHKCGLSRQPFLLPEGALCPVLEYEYAPDDERKEQHPEDAEAWTYVVHPALVIAGPEAVHAALWELISDACRGLGEMLLDLEQATQVAGAFDPAEAAEGWPRRAFQTWVGKIGEGNRRLKPCGFHVPEEKAA